MSEKSLDIRLLFIMQGYLLVNFGGPRAIEEIAPFLRALLTDIDVIHPTFPRPFHHLLFSFIAQRRAKIIAKDYEEIGGKSPIFEETEHLAKLLEGRLNAPVFTFHRYLPSTHKKTLSLMENTPCQKITVFPLFPQFTYATTGSCARFFAKRLSRRVIDKLNWVPSYPTHVAFTSLWRKILEEFLENHHLKEEETFFLFSAHGLPQAFIDEGDPYEKECQLCVKQVMQAFPKICYHLSYQSQFGKEKWIQPYTSSLCQNVLSWHKGKKNILFVPISFTSDHIETLFEVEKIYMPLIKKAALSPFRVPACYSHSTFPDVIMAILEAFSPCHTSLLIRNTYPNNRTGKRVM